MSDRVPARRGVGQRETNGLIARHGCTLIAGSARVAGGPPGGHVVTVLGILADHLQEPWEGRLATNPRLEEDPREDMTDSRLPG